MTRYVASVLVLSLLLMASVPAAAKPHRWYKDWKWWAGEAVIVTAVALDGKSTCDAFARGMVEGAPLLRGTRSCATISGVLVGAGAFYTTLHLLDHKFITKSDGQIVNFIGYAAVPIAVGAVHGQAAARNFSHE